MISAALCIAVSLGFQTATLPIRAGAVGRLAWMLVKLNGVIAKMKPSSGRCSSWFQMPLGLIGGWSA